MGGHNVSYNFDCPAYMESHFKLGMRFHFLDLDLRGAFEDLKNTNQVCFSRLHGTS